MIDDYRWRYAIVAQWRAMEEREQELLRVMVEQGLTLRQIVAIYRALWCGTAQSSTWGRN